ncbi:MAG: pyridoxamine 5'-phosphate oxidase family protein [Gemmatimonadetes bacterium]|jgi:uncharacterized protein|nr:pyridoxamine 5'-phosphate oxidase family protein [Gemmatimonadota bacterium]MBT4611344.1 pyridoxamine 5'-phosphate oxidase family protein [Gemmatimonadota bacterium]MBT5056928.1 pyridoxamine 5'-phosphate oxidase family protein [Gemmatimonadota bacterium]MBT5142181.1 pyridoxamine 5'-phosphate oxidase family protein [Gemmatimonadota bacterium]MBT5589234.1 pyridoxamine 5'-phosphate oxidase family protein [Gemmatimonadota bacterium]
MTDVAPTNRYQETFGTPSERARTKVVDYLDEFVQNFIRHAPFAVLASADGDGNCDASPKGGTPGFARIIDERHLLLPDVRGNNLFQSYDNIDSNPRVGLVFFIPGMDYTARVNGQAEVVSEDDLRERGMDLNVFDPDDNAALQQGLLIKVEEAYPHCPRALKFSRLWDTEMISTNRETPPVKR